jgi:hypothetical protein
MTPKKNYILFLIILLASSVNAQSGQDKFITVIAGKEYQKSKFFQMLWGENWRKEWLVPVRVPVVLLDTLYGGLHPYEKGGGNESKSLHLKSVKGKEYVLRSIDKNRSHLVPGVLKNSLFGDVIRDGVSMNHPYAAFALPGMMQEANINHPQPILVYIPEQKALDTFKKFANNLYLLEEKPDGDWSDAKHLGNFKKYYSTLKVKENLRDDNKYKADQHAYIKARLFDILISDVDRHYDNWRWGVADTGTEIFKPVPRDRDQAFFTRKGLLSGISLIAIRRRHLQRFDYEIKKVKTLTSADRSLDKFFATEMTYEDWRNAALALQHLLTDSVISNSIRQMPPEAFAISGMEIIDKLKYRRNKLQETAARYYYVMAREVEINGSKQKEYFEVKTLPNKQVVANVYRADDIGKRESIPYYHRLFNSEETKRITLYGLGGDDVFDIDKEIRKIKIVVKKGNNKEQFPDKKDAETQ